MVHKTLIFRLCESVYCFYKFLRLLEENFRIWSWKMCRLLCSLLYCCFIKQGLSLELLNFTDGGPTPKDGTLFFPDNNSEPVAAHLNGINPKFVDINAKANFLFYLYTRKNKNNFYQLTIDSKENLKKSFFDSSKATKVIIHGFGNNISSPIIQYTKDKYLERGSYNVIGVGWGDLAKPPYYFTASRGAMKVGHQLAKLIDFLVREGNMNLKTLHLIGHSLGAHAAGIAGKNIKTGTINRITALDPAKPLFERVLSFWRVNKNDASFVDGIHTCSDFLGLEMPVGHVDFYPNYGKAPQPGCSKELAGVCSHGRAWHYFVESIISPTAFSSVQCKSLNEIIKQNCNEQTKAPTPFMGDDAYKFNKTFWNLLNWIFPKQSIIYYTKISHDKFPFGTSK